MAVHSHKILIAHPARQGNIYERPLAVFKARNPLIFFTGLYYNPSKFPYNLVKYFPAGWRERCLVELEKRRIPGFDSNLVITLGGPWLELVLRPLNFMRTWIYSFDWLMARWIRHHKIDAEAVLVHCFQEAAYFTVRAAKAKGYITLHEMTLPFPPPQTNLPDGPEPPPAWTDMHPLKIDVLAMKEADYVLAQSHFSVDVLRRWGIPDRKIVLLPFGVDLTRYHPAVAKDPSAPWRALFVGQLGYRKGLEHLLEAWKQLALPQAELVLVGYPNEEGKVLLKKYKGNYRYTGFVSDSELLEIYRQADVFILPSGLEGGANVVYEALASGLPCLVSPHASAVVQEGISGFIVPWGDVGVLKNRIRLLYEDRKRCATMSKAARRRAEQFSWDEFGRRLNLIYQRILEGALEGGNSVFDSSEM